LYTTLDPYISRINNNPQCYKMIHNMILDAHLDKKISRQEFFDLDDFMRKYATNWVIEVD
jgi:hypothetical protein